MARIFEFPLVDRRIEVCHRHSSGFLRFVGIQQSPGFLCAAIPCPSCSWVCCLCLCSEPAGGCDAEDWPPAWLAFSRSGLFTSGESRGCTHVLHSQAMSCIVEWIHSCLAYPSLTPSILHSLFDPHRIHASSSPLPCPFTCCMPLTCVHFLLLCLRACICPATPICLH